MRDSTKTSPRPRGRPRAFEPDAALDALTRVFWTRGFAAASLDELAASAGVNRPSLYAAFGDKRTMYLRAIEKVAAQLEAVLAEALRGARPLEDELTTFYEQSIANYLDGDPGPRGCLILCTAPSAALDEPAVKDALRAMLTVLDRSLEKRFTAARAAGELAADADVRALSRLAASALHSLAIRARAGEGRASLVTLARATVALTTGAPRARATR